MALELTDANIDNVLAEKKITLIDFYATWCGPCRMLTPIIDKLSTEFADESIAIAKLDIGDNKESATSYSIKSIPTILIFKGDEVVDRMVGIQNLETLKNKIEALITTDEAEGESEN